MVQLEKFVPVRGATSHGAHDGRSRGDTFALSSPADPDPMASYEPPSDYTRLHPSPDGDAASDTDKRVRSRKYDHERVVFRAVTSRACL
jgi:hypothetical protein